MTTPTINCHPAGTSDDVPQWRFKCPYCATWHYHSGQPVGFEWS
jgi:hypothetical protein